MKRDADPMIGRVLDGRYRVGPRIARGGMATVYEAHDLRLDRECAIKIMHGDLGDDHDFAKRFVREAQSAARLSHPNVVSVTDQGDDDGVLFLVMEHVPGRTLRDLIRDDAPVPPSRALALLEPVLMALAEAHRNGIVHRDVKPENVLIADDGRVKVADFGLARAVNANTQHTKTGGILIGTVSYLAPELIVNGKADPRSDVYAAGVILYELLTGRKPHEGEGAIQIAYKHVNEDVPPPSAASSQDIPPYVDALVARATARDRELRQADAKVFLHQLRRVRAALDAGERDDPELTADLTPTTIIPAVGIDYVSDGDRATQVQPAVPTAAPSASSTSTLEAVPAVEADEEHTTFLEQEALGAAVLAPTVAAPAVTPEPGTVAPSAQGAEPVLPRRGASGRPSDATPVAPTPRNARRRSRRGPLLLVIVALLVAAVAYGGWWLGVGRYTTTPAVLNLSVTAATQKVEAAGLTLEVAGEEFSETVPAGSIIETDPGAGDRIVEGGTVEVIVSKGPERYEVPRLRRVQASEVAGVLEDTNLTLGEVTEVFNERVPEGVVISSDPAAGTELRPDTAVDVTVSKGPKPIDIPDFTGRNGERAQARLGDLGFAVSATEEFNEEVAAGLVISQDPASGTGFKGDEIQLVISKGPPLVEVPNFQASSVEDARAELEALGLRVDVVRTQFYIGLDRVARQDPGGGTSIPKGSTVTLFVV